DAGPVGAGIGGVVVLGRLHEPKAVAAAQNVACARPREGVRGCLGGILLRKAVLAQARAGLGPGMLQRKPLGDQKVPKMRKEATLDRDALLVAPALELLEVLRIDSAAHDGGKRLHVRREALQDALAPLKNLMLEVDGVLAVDGQRARGSSLDIVHLF